MYKTFAGTGEVPAGASGFFVGSSNVSAGSGNIFVGSSNVLAVIYNTPAVQDSRGRGQARI